MSLQAPSRPDLRREVHNAAGRVGFEASTSEMSPIRLTG